ncbi:MULTISPECIES: Sec-independent protein translocase subunit TatA [Nitrospirillum]|uniref:Sec-independent protein translocase protein TatA n=1 Tax=Nitrospirillum amazonense TaxID=28077 RepID=A0A560K260_9PROT|nr:Sec-independent protein translocase subunit TatA [Nitrospirillum amazonense]EGY02310.1 Sec-independent protein translocase protein [Nitrospirillum amazonense Y2]MDG3443875.1 Sec-independent protein translocase subunit TatA [Nitrospirillum amazonense]TWB59615.1 sec-independent protein translocase protein TatA [Nitrospirillum amazonense]TWB77435.1 sec-independent protein translocase protein TatA [Nitrospirillum amazonense]
MGSFSIWHWLIVLFIALLLFGNRLPRMMGDFGKGIKNFKAGLNEQEEGGASAPRSIDGHTDAATTSAPKDTVSKG